MRTRTAIVLLGALCAAVVAVAAAPEQAEYTVGEFSVRLVKMITQRPGYTPKEAAALLDRIGIKIEGDAASRVDEALLVDAFSQIGVSLTTSNPDRPVTRDTADKVFGLFEGHGTFQETNGTENSVKCKSGPKKGEFCASDADCPGSFCNIPPGQAKKIASATDG